MAGSNVETSNKSPGAALSLPAAVACMCKVYFSLCKMPNSVRQRDIDFQIVKLHTSLQNGNEIKLKFPKTNVAEPSTQLTIYTPKDVYVSQAQEKLFRAKLGK